MSEFLPPLPLGEGWGEGSHGQPSAALTRPSRGQGSHVWDDQRKRLSRRAVLAAAALIGASCGAATETLRLTVAFPERSLSYAPLLLAAGAGLNTTPPVQVSLMQRASGRDVAGVVADGTAAAGALSLPDFVHAAAEGAPLVAIGAITRRLAAELVVASSVTTERTLESIHRGAWRGLRIGVESGADGTEAFTRSVALASSWTPAALARNLLAPDPYAAEPRWLPLETGEALVAALEDNRIDAYVGRPFAAAQSTTLGRGAVLPQAALGPAVPGVAGAFATVIVAHRDRLPAEWQNVLPQLVGACALAGAELSGPHGTGAAARALPERDALHLAMALRLMAPSPSETAYATDSRLPATAVERYLELSARAGRPLGLNAGTLVTTRFSG